MTTSTIQEIQGRIRALALDVAREKLGATQKELDRVGTVRVYSEARRSAVAGAWHPAAHKIVMNLTLTNDVERYEKTLRHEWAHALVTIVLQSRSLFRRIPAHGPEWKNTARLMGHSGDRCHTYDVAAAMPEKYTTYHCPGCKETRPVSKLRANKMKVAASRGMAYRCRKCKSAIVVGGAPVSSEVIVVPVSIAAEAPRVVSFSPSAFKSATAMFKALIIDGRLTDDQIFTAVQKAFGTEERHRKSYVAWYRRDLQKKGLL